MNSVSHKHGDPTYKTGSELIEMDEIGFVSHAAMENRLHHFRTVK